MAQVAFNHIIIYTQAQHSTICTTLHSTAGLQAHIPNI